MFRVMIRAVDAAYKDDTANVSSATDDVIDDLTDHIISRQLAMLF